MRFLLTKIGISFSSQFHLAATVNETLHCHSHHPRHPKSRDQTTQRSLPTSRILGQTLSDGGGRNQVLGQLPGIVSLVRSPVQAQSKVDSAAEVTHRDALRL